MSDAAAIVLLLEDNVLLQDLLAKALADADCEVKAALDAAEAAHVLLNSDPAPEPGAGRC